jgi:hypothetical protein
MFTPPVEDAAARCRRALLNSTGLFNRGRQELSYWGGINNYSTGAEQLAIMIRTGAPVESAVGI